MACPTVRKTVCLPIWTWQLWTLPVNVWSSLSEATIQRYNSRLFRGRSLIYQHLPIMPKDMGEAFCITCNWIWHHTILWTFPHAYSSDAEMLDLLFNEWHYLSQISHICSHMYSHENSSIFCNTFCSVKWCGFSLLCSADQSTDVAVQSRHNPHKKA